MRGRPTARVVNVASERDCTVIFVGGMTTVIKPLLLSGELPAVQFVGYESLTSPARILAMVRGTQRVQEAAAGDEIEVILDRTPAYAESGGQMGDAGTLAGRQGRGEILDTYYRGSKLIVHRVAVRSGGFHENEDVAVTVETPRRLGLRHR